MVILAELRRSASFFPLKDTVEVAQIVVATEIANVSYALVGIDKHARGITKTDVDDILADRSSRMKLEETAESRLAHASQLDRKSVVRERV